jgi:hypothetical protein
MAPASAAIDHQTAKAMPEIPAMNSANSPIEIFRERCWAKAMLVREGQADLQDAVDQLQEVAVSQGLLKEYGQDEVQAILAESFARWSV